MTTRHADHQDGISVASASGALVAGSGGPLSHADGSTPRTESDPPSPTGGRS